MNIKKNDLMFEIESSFLKKLFEKLRLKFGNSRKASNFLKIPHSTFRAYKNGYASSLPNETLKKIMETKIISKEEIEKNVKHRFYRKEQIKKAMDKGNKIRIEKLKKWKQEIPPLKEILKYNHLDFERWFLAYKKLIDFGPREFNYVKIKKDYVEVSYTTHSHKLKKEFVLKFPRKIFINEDFLYFFGLWVGDKSGGKRIGIVNKEREILSFAEEYLKKLYQNTEVYLYIGIKEKIPNNYKYDKIFWIKQKGNGVSFSIHAINGILTSFFYYLQSNLNQFLYNVENFNIFFAGLFDAEGNISLEDTCFRWSCKDEYLKQIFKIHLKRLDLFKRDDGVNLVTYNKNIFKDKILPYIIHPKKINNSNLIYYKKGKLERRFMDILEFILKNPGVTNKELAKALKKKKLYAQVKVLERLGYTHSKNYPKQIFINKQKLHKLQ